MITVIAFLLLGLILWDLHGWRVKAWFIQDEPIVSDEQHEKLVKDIEVCEPMSEAEIAELDDFFEFEDAAEDPEAIEATVNALIVYAAFKQRPDDELWSVS